jgi:hypothetical protein
MLLGTRRYALNDVRVIRVNYNDWLAKGYVLKAVTANITPTSGITSTVGAITLDPTETVAFITLNCGSISESFTLNIQAQDTFGQTINDVLNVSIVTASTT